MPEFLFEGASLHYEEEGEGEPLLLLHGNGENLHYFDQQIPFFAQYYHVIAMDTRAHGESTRGEGELNFDHFADDAAALLDHLGIDRAHVLGFSDGGNTAMLLALRHPDKVRSLLLNGANACPNGVKLQWRFWTAVGYWMLLFFAQFSQKAAYKRDILRLMVKHPRLTSVHLGAIHTPTLIVVGQFDMIKPEHSQMIARNIRHAQIVTIRGAGHFAAQNHPDRFNKIAQEFYFGVDGRTTEQILPEDG